MPLVEEFEMRRAAHHFASPRPRDHLRSARIKIVQAEKIDLMAAELRLEHEDEGRVLVDQDLFERVHDECELVRHCCLRTIAPSP